MPNSGQKRLLKHFITRLPESIHAWKLLNLKMEAKIHATKMKFQITARTMSYQK
jgi:hypothetical protein